MMISHTITNRSLDGLDVSLVQDESLSGYIYVRPEGGHPSVL